MVELLVVVVIIGILAGMVLGALQMARQGAREAATKATITKLNNIIMQRYESYMTRRVAIPIPPGLTPAQQAAWNLPTNAARRRLDAIRDIMRMEMPDAKSDIVNADNSVHGPTIFSSGGIQWSVPQPALHAMYATNPPTSDHDAAQCLFLLVSIGSPEAMEQFNQSEIGTVEGKPVFVDAWGTPIMWLRWAPGYSSCTDPGFVAATGTNYTGSSDIQSGVAQPYPKLQANGTPLLNASGNPVMATADHDPFDSRNVDAFAFHMIPLVYSAGPDKVYDLNLVAGYVFNGNPYADMHLGEPMAGGAHHDNITNHHIEQR